MPNLQPYYYDGTRRQKQRQTNGGRPTKRHQFGADRVASESHDRVRFDGRGGLGQWRHVLPGRGQVESPLLSVQRGSYCA